MKCHTHDCTAICNSATACDCHLAANDPSSCPRATNLNSNAVKFVFLNDLLNVAGNDYDYPGVYDEGAFRRNVLN